jgi:hypothetical protein
MIKGRNKGPTEVATKQLRHSGPDMTYRYYAQLRSDTAFEEVNNLFPEKEVAIIHEFTTFAEHPDRKTFLVTGENISAG